MFFRFQFSFLVFLRDFFHFYLFSLIICIFTFIAISVLVILVVKYFSIWCFSSNIYILFKLWKLF